MGYFLPDAALPLKPRPPHAAGLNGGSESGFDPTPAGPSSFESGRKCSCVAAAWLSLVNPGKGRGVVGGGGAGVEVDAAAGEDGAGAVPSHEGGGGPYEGRGAIPSWFSAFPRTTSMGLSCPLGVIST